MASFCGRIKNHGHPRRVNAWTVWQMLLAER